MDIEAGSHFSAGSGDDRSSHEIAIDSGERESSVSAGQLYENLYPMIRETRDPNELKAMVEAWKTMDISELGPGWSEGVRTIVIDIALDTLTMPPLNEFDYVLEELAQVDSFERRNLESVLGWIAHGDEKTFKGLETLYDRLTPSLKHAILVNILPVMGSQQFYKRKFLLEHIDDLDSRDMTQDVLTLARLFDEHQEVQAAANRNTQP